MLSLGIGNRFKAQVIECREWHPDFGKVVFETPEATNLILENGMNGIASKAICNLFLYCAVGSGNTPTQDSSGLITATASGTSVVASSGIFSPSNVGELLRFATGQKAVIASYTNSTHVTLATSLTVASPTLFTMYRIAQTGLTTETRRTNNYAPGTYNNNSVIAASGITHTRTFDFPVEVSNVNYSEVGFSDSATPGNNLNMRGLFALAPVPVGIGQKLRVSYTVQLSTTPTTPRSASVSITGWPAIQYPATVNHSNNTITVPSLPIGAFPLNTPITLAGTTPPSPLSFGTVYYTIPFIVPGPDQAVFEVSATPSGSPITITSNGVGVSVLTNTNGFEQLLAPAFSIVNNDPTQGAFGGTVYLGSAMNEPFGIGNKLGSISVDSNPIPPYSLVEPPSSSVLFTILKYIPLTQASYTNGSYTTSWGGTFAVNDANSSVIRKIYLADQIGLRGAYCYFFNYNQQKQVGFTLQVNWTFKWDRTFM